MLLRHALLAFCLLGLQSCESRHEISACITRDGIDRRYGTFVSQLLQLNELELESELERAKLQITTAMETDKFILEVHVKRRSRRNDSVAEELFTHSALPPTRKTFYANSHYHTWRTGLIRGYASTKPPKIYRWLMEWMAPGEFSDSFYEEYAKAREGNIDFDVLQLSEQIETRHHTVWAKVLFDYHGLLDDTKQLISQSRRCPARSRP